MFINHIARFWCIPLPHRIGGKDNIAIRPARFSQKSTSSVASTASSEWPAATYAARITPYLLHPTEKIEITVVVRPDRSPDIGTLCGLGFAFALARGLKTDHTHVGVLCDVWGRANGDEKAQEFLAEYEEVLRELSTRYSIEHRIRTEEEFLSHGNVSTIIQEVVLQRSSLAKELPAGESATIHAGCPVCGASNEADEKHSNSNNPADVSFSCTSHGRFEVNVYKDPSRFQFSPQLLHLLRGRLYERAKYNWIEICTGDDWTTFSEEHALCGATDTLPLMVYTPPINGWSKSLEPLGSPGSRRAWGWKKKIQKKKTEIVRRERGYLPDYRAYKNEGKELDTVWEEIERWVNRPGTGPGIHNFKYPLF